MRRRRKKVFKKAKHFEVKPSLSRAQAEDRVPNTRLRQAPSSPNTEALLAHLNATFILLLQKPTMPAKRNDKYEKVQYLSGLFYFFRVL